MRTIPNPCIFFEILRIYSFRNFFDYSAVLFCLLLRAYIYYTCRLILLFTSRRIFLFGFLIRIFYRSRPGIKPLPRYKSVHGREYYFLFRNNKKLYRNDLFPFLIPSVPGRKHHLLTRIY